MELEEELKVVGNSLKSLEVSEEKVNNQKLNGETWFFSDSIHQNLLFSRLTNVLKNTSSKLNH